MKPFKDEGQFRSHSSTPTTAPKSLPDYTYAHGVEVRNGLRIYNRKNLAYISSGQWLSEYETGFVSQETNVSILGENGDTLDYAAYNDQDERRTPAQVLDSSEIFMSDTIDYDDSTSKDGRITVFNLNNRSLVMRDEYPFSVRGFKATNDTYSNITSGQNYTPYSDYTGYDLGLVKQGFYGIPDKVTSTFEDHVYTSSLGFSIDYGDYDSNNTIGTCGTPLYSSVFGVDSIAYAGLLR